MPFDEVVDGVNNRMKGSHYKDPNNDREWNKGWKNDKFGWITVNHSQNFTGQDMILIKGRKLTHSKWFCSYFLQRVNFLFLGLYNAPCGI